MHAAGADAMDKPALGSPQGNNASFVQHF